MYRTEACKYSIQTSYWLEFFALIALLGAGCVEGGTVSSISFSIPDDHCFVGNRDAQAVISFTPAVTVPVGGVITLNYPSGFLKAVVPVVVSGTNVISAALPDLVLNVMLLTVSSGSITGSIACTMTLVGLAIQAIPSGSVNSIWVTTSMDSGTPVSVSTGTKILEIAFKALGQAHVNNWQDFEVLITAQNAVARFAYNDSRTKYSFLSKRSSSVKTPGQVRILSTDSDILLPFINNTEAIKSNVTDSASIIGFIPGQRILTMTRGLNVAGCFEVWTNGTHFLEQGNQKSELQNYQLTSACPLCRDCASSIDACEGKCNVGGTLKCKDPPPLGIGPIEWNYRCFGKRDALNNLQRFLTDEFQVGLRTWKKNADGTLNQGWFIIQVSKAFSISNESVVVLETRIDFFNVILENFVVPASDQGTSDRGLIVSFMVARESREQIEKKLELFGHRLVLRRYIDAITIRLRPALATNWQKWTRLEPLQSVEPEQADKIFPLVLFLSCAVVGMVPRAFWRAFPALVMKFTADTTKAAGKAMASGNDGGEEDEEEDEED